MIPPHSRRNFSEIYKKMPMKELQSKLPTFDFESYLSPLLPRKLNETEEVVIYALTYYQKLVTLLDSTPSRVISNYVLWRFIRHRLNNLDSRFQGVQNDLFRVLFGREETPARWRFCVSYVNGNLGNSVGSMFVKKYFDEQSKRDVSPGWKSVHIAHT